MTAAPFFASISAISLPIPLPAPVQCNVADFASSEAFAKEILAKYQKVDILVNNAGVTSLFPLTFQFLQCFIQIRQLIYIQAFDVLIDLFHKTTKRCVPLKVSGPFHSQLLSGAGDKLEKELYRIKLRNPSIPYPLDP